MKLRVVLVSKLDKTKNKLEKKMLYNEIFVTLIVLILIILIGVVAKKRTKKRGNYVFDSQENGSGKDDSVTTNTPKIVGAIKYCSKCGAEIVEGAAFCAKCGCAVGFIETKRSEIGKEFVVGLVELVLGVVGVLYSAITMASDKTGNGWKRYTYTPPLSDHEIVILVVLVISVIVAGVGVRTLKISKYNL